KHLRSAGKAIRTEPGRIRQLLPGIPALANRHEHVQVKILTSPISPNTTMRPFPAIAVIIAGARPLVQALPLPQFAIDLTGFPSLPDNVASPSGDNFQPSKRLDFGEVVVKLPNFAEGTVPSPADPDVASRSPRLPYWPEDPFLDPTAGPIHFDPPPDPIAGLTSASAESSYSSPEPDSNVASRGASAARGLDDAPWNALNEGEALPASKRFDLDVGADRTLGTVGRSPSVPPGPDVAFRGPRIPWRPSEDPCSDHWATRIHKDALLEPFPLPHHPPAGSSSSSSDPSPDVAPRDEPEDESIPDWLYDPLVHRDAGGLTSPSNPRSAKSSRNAPAGATLREAAQAESRKRLQGVDEHSNMHIDKARMPHPAEPNSSHSPLADPDVAPHNEPEEEGNIHSGEYYPGLFTYSTTP
ncbi:uncharacterized protein B0I36DRAFT_416619, partial [Microdochium trichocladiopsis]